MILERNIYAAVLSVLVVLFGCWPYVQTRGTASVAVGVLVAAISAAWAVDAMRKKNAMPIDGIGRYMLSVVLGYAGAMFPSFRFTGSNFIGSFGTMVMQPTEHFRFVGMVLFVAAAIVLLTKGLFNWKWMVACTVAMCLGFGWGFGLLYSPNWTLYGLPWLLELLVLTAAFLFLQWTGTRSSLAWYILIAIWITIRPVFFVDSSAMQSYTTYSSPLPWTAFLLSGLLSPVSLLVISAVAFVAMMRISNDALGWVDAWRGKTEPDTSDGAAISRDGSGLYEVQLLLTSVGAMWLLNFVLRYPIQLRWFALIVFFIIAVRVVKRSGTTESFLAAVRKIIISAVVLGLAVVLIYHGQYLLSVVVVVFAIWLMKVYDAAKADTSRVPWIWQVLLLFIAYAAVAFTVVHGFAVQKVVFIAASLVMASAAMWMSRQDVPLPYFNIWGLKSRAFVFAAIKASITVAFAVIAVLAVNGGPGPATIDYEDPSSVVSNVALTGTAAEGTAVGVTVHVDHPEQVKSVQYQTSNGHVLDPSLGGKAQSLDLAKPAINLMGGRHVVVWVTYKDGSVSRTDRWTDVQWISFPPDDMPGRIVQFIIS
ncbi:hypothetical protein COO72_06365 [Bifidobacterium callitrichos]|nr:hypothetical protein COO72_06365 [Bifidobacterium callitrichos]